MNDGHAADAAAGRHAVVNTLLRYLRAVDGHQLDEVLAVLRYATVSFDGAPRRGPDELTETYRAAFAAGGRTCHLLHEVHIDVPDDAADGDSRLVARAAYQRWSLEAEPPALTALGHYTAVFDPDGAGLRLVRLGVDRLWQRATTPSPSPTTVPAARRHPRSEDPRS